MRGGLRQRRLRRVGGGSVRPRRRPRRLPLTLPPDTASAEDLRRFQLHMVDSGASPITLNATITGLKFFFEVTVGHGEVMAKILARQTANVVELHSLNPAHPPRQIDMNDVDRPVPPATRRSG